MASRLKLRHFTGLAVISVVLTYQNCAPMPDSSDDVASYQSTLPFAYNTKVDTIGYMSCSNLKVAVQPRAYFSYRVGAYNNSTGGMSLTDAFKTATQFYNVTDRGQALSESTLNANTVLSLSVRSMQNLQAMSFQQPAMRTGFDVDAFLPQLDSPDVAGPLVGLSPGRMMNYFPGPGDQRLMEASLRWYEFENLSADNRNNLDTNGQIPSYLVVGYSNTSDILEGSLRTPPGALPVGSSTPAAALPDQAYGTGFKLTFGVPYGWGSAERHVLGGIAEYDLSTHPNTRSKTANWDCSVAYQFMIVRPDDVANGLVYFNPIPDPPPPGQAASNAIRRVLRVEDWYVDLANMSVMPKHTGDYCYGTLTNQVVNYQRGVCANGAIVNGVSTVCPHFVSVCIRH